MPAVPFAQLPDGARLWIFGAARSLTDEEQSLVLQVTDAFIEDWSAHGAPVHAGRELAHDQFLLIGVDEAATALSGCSIDGMVRALKDLERRLRTSLVDGTGVFYRDGQELSYASRAEFKALAEEGSVAPTTMVFDTTVDTVGEYRADGLEVRATDAWHGQAFFSLKT